MNMRTHRLSDTLSLLGLNEKAWDGKEGVGEEMLRMDGWRESHRFEAAETAPLWQHFAIAFAGVPTTPWITVA